MKNCFSWLLYCLFISVSYAEENSRPYDVQVSVAQIEGRFQILASYVVPISVCSAYAYIVNYEGAKNIPGILESKVISRAGNKVRVYRQIEDFILFFPIDMKSTIEYTELPFRALNFEQISGDTRFYKGSWKLIPDKEKTVFKYEALIEPNSLVPSAVIEYFMKNSIRSRFESMAHNAASLRPPEIPACR